MQGILPNARFKIMVAELTLLRTGSYNPMFLRPYTPYAEQTDIDMITQRLNDVSPSSITPEFVSSIASRIMRPDATPHSMIHIPNGWETPRIAFMMEIHAIGPTGNTVIYYIQGYTSHGEISHGNNIDPNMEFYINSFMTVSRVPQVDAAGNAYMVDRVTETAQVINGQIISQTANEALRMAPHNLFYGIQSVAAEDAYSSYTQKSVNDTRIKIGLDSHRSSRNNNVPARFLSKIMSAQISSNQHFEIGHTNGNMADRSAQATYEAPLNENPFIAAISRLRGQLCSTSFTMNNLVAIDSSANTRTNLVTVGGVQQLNHLHGQTANWTASDRETQVANIISCALPALMMQLSIGHIYFTCNNHDTSGAFNYHVLDARALSNLDLRRNFDTCMQRFHDEVMFDVTYGNQELYMLEVSAHLFGETRIKIRLSNGEYEYIVPSFCDAITMPIIADNANTFNAVVNCVDVLNQAVSTACSNVAMHAPIPQGF